MNNKKCLVTLIWNDEDEIYSEDIVMYLNLDKKDYDYVYSQVYSQLEDEGPTWDSFTYKEITEKECCSKLKTISLLGMFFSLLVILIKVLKFV